MPTITAQGKTFNCKTGENLRQALLDNGIDLYSPRANYVNCMGIGTCGTCAVAIEGTVSDVNWRDRARRALPPHTPTKALRLACQTKVLGDIKVSKFKGFWGHEDTLAWTPTTNTTNE
ncbi:MAG: 2Fe-2S iron-sulfur cluster-binding protein [Cyanobacteria bacterium J06598_3]